MTAQVFLKKRVGAGMKNRVLVRCLGPGVEHEFLSHDRVRNRVCPRCKRLIAEMGSRCSSDMGAAETIADMDYQCEGGGGVNFAR